MHGDNERGEKVSEDEEWGNQDLHNGRGSTESHTYVEILMFYFQRSALGHTWDENGISVSFLAVGRT